MCSHMTGRWCSNNKNMANIPLELERDFKKPVSNQSYDQLLIFYIFICGLFKRTVELGTQEGECPPSSLTKSIMAVT